MPSWPSGKRLVAHLQEEHAAALKTEQLVGRTNQRRSGQSADAEQGASQHGASSLAAGRSTGRDRRDPQSPFASDRTARRLRSKPTPDSMPPLPEVKQEDDLAGQAVRTSPGCAGGGKPCHGREFPGPRRTSRHVAVGGFRRAVWSARGVQQLRPVFQNAFSATTPPSEWCFASRSSVRRNGPAPRLPTPLRLKAKKDAEAAKNQVSEETLRLQRSVEQMAAAQEVADLEYQSRAIGSGIAAGAPGRRDALTGTTYRMRASRPTSVTILYRMQISSWNGPGSLCCGPLVSWKTGSASANS